MDRSSLYPLGDPLHGYSRFDANQKSEVEADEYWLNTLCRRSHGWCVLQFAFLVVSLAIHRCYSKRIPTHVIVQAKRELKSASWCECVKNPRNGLINNKPFPSRLKLVKLVVSQVQQSYAAHFKARHGKYDTIRCMHHTVHFLPISRWMLNWWRNWRGQCKSASQCRSVAIGFWVFYVLLPRDIMLSCVRRGGSAGYYTNSEGTHGWSRWLARLRTMSASACPPYS